MKLPFRNMIQQTFTSISSPIDGYQVGWSQTILILLATLVLCSCRSVPTDKDGNIPPQPPAIKGEAPKTSSTEPTKKKLHQTAENKLSRAAGEQLLVTQSVKKSTR